jgi:hypothetical protein
MENHTKHFSARCDQFRPYRVLEEGNDQTIEQEIQDKVLTAPRVPPADIEANNQKEQLSQRQ